MEPVFTVFCQSSHGVHMITRQNNSKSYRSAESVSLQTAPPGEAFRWGSGPSASARSRFPPWGCNITGHITVYTIHPHPLRCYHHFVTGLGGAMFWSIFMCLMWNHFLRLRPFMQLSAVFCPLKVWCASCRKIRGVALSTSPEYRENAGHLPDRSDLVPNNLFTHRSSTLKETGKLIESMERKQGCYEWRALHKCCP